MPQPVLINAGSRTTASLLASAVPAFAYKAADQQSGAHVTTLFNDNDLVLAVTANYIYEFSAFIDYEGGTQGSSDITWKWNVPSGATLRYSWTGYGIGGSWGGGLNLAADTPAASSNGAGNLRPITMKGTLFVASTAGSIQFMWAQNTSSATNTIVHAQSELKLIRMA